MNANASFQNLPFVGKFLNQSDMRHLPRMKQCGGRVQAVLNVLAVVLCCTTMMVFTACSDSDDNSGGSSSLSDIERMRLEEWVACPRSSQALRMRIQPSSR